MFNRISPRGIAQKLLVRLGYRVSSLRLSQLRDVFEQTMVDWTRGNFQKPHAGPMRALGVVFSKDRALQLNALLESWFANCNGTARIVVLWTVSDSNHERSYKELMDIWESKVEWVREKSFRSDLLEILEKDSSSHLFFLTDDAMMLGPFSLEEALLPDTGLAVFSLKHDPALKWCFVPRKPQTVPELQSRGTNLLTWNWSDGEPRCDWAFPLSVDGAFFSREEFRVVLKNLPFKNPNTLEDSLQAFNPLFLGRKGVCFQKAVIVNVPCNMVQTEFDHPITALFSIQELRDRWFNGERIAWEDFQGMNSAQAETHKYRFVAKENSKG